MDRSSRSRQNTDSNGFQSLTSPHLERQQKAIQEVHNVMKGEKKNSPNLEEAKQILKIVKEIKPEECTMKELKKDAYNLVHYQQTKMAVFPIDSSGSSEEEVQPEFKTAEEIVPLIFGAPETLKVYFVVKVLDQRRGFSHENLPLRVEVLKAGRDAQSPNIVHLQTAAPFAIYQLELSSLVRSFRVVFEHEGIQYSTKEIPNKASATKTLLTEIGIGLDFSLQKKVPLSLLEELITFSVGLPEKSDEIIQIAKKNMNKLLSESEEIEDLIESVKKQQKHKQTFAQLLLFLLQKSKMNENPSAFRILGTVLPSMSDNDLSPQLLDKSFRLMIFCEQSGQILKQRENKILMTSFFRLLVQKRDVQEFIRCINVLIHEKVRLLKREMTCSTFILDYVNKLTINASQKFYVLVSTVYYYTLGLEKAHDHKLFLDSFDQLTPEEVTHNLFDSEASQKMKKMIEGRSFAIQSLSIKQFAKFLNIYKILAMRAEWLSLIDEELNEKAKKYLKQISRYINGPEDLKVAIRMISQVYLGSFWMGMVGKDKEKELSPTCDMFLNKNKQRFQNNVECLKQFNEFIFLRAIYNGLGRSVKKEYLQILKTLGKRKTILSILDTGIKSNQIYFENMRYETELGEILSIVIRNLYSSEDIVNYRESGWHYKFQFSCFINERIIQAMIDLKNRQLEENMKQHFIRHTEEMINDSSASEEDKQILKIIITIQEMKFGLKNLVEYLRKPEKIYLAIIDKILKKEDDKTMEVRRNVKLIERDLEEGNMAFSAIKEMLPYKNKDISRFVSIFGKRIFDKIKHEILFIERKIQSLNSKKNYLQILHNKFQLNEADFKTQLKQIQTRIENLTKGPTRAAEEVDDLERQYPHQLLALYSFPFFYRDQVLARLRIPDLKILNGQRLNLFHEVMKDILHALVNKEILMEKFHFIGLLEMKDQEVEIILGACGEEVNKEGEGLKQFLKLNKKLRVYECVAQSLEYFMAKDINFISQNQKNLRGLTKIMKLMKEREVERVRRDELQECAENFERALKEIQILPNNKSWQIYSLFPLEDLTETNELFQDLMIQRNISALIFLILLHQRFSRLTLLSKYSESYETMKEMIDEEVNDEINLKSTDLQDLMDMLSFAKEYILLPLERGKTLFPIFGFLRSQEQDRMIRKFIGMTNKVKQFERLYEKIKGSKNSEKASISKIIEESELKIKFKALEHKVEFSMVNKNEEVFPQLESLKDQALIILSRINEQRNQDALQVKKKMETFLQLYHLIDSVQKMEKTLISFGLLFFQDMEECIPIRNEDLLQLTRYSQKKQKYLRDWKQKMEEVYSNSPNATMLKGGKMKKFYLYLIGSDSKTKAKYFRYICHEEKMEEIKKQVRAPEDQSDPFECLKTIQEFFRSLKESLKYQMAPDRDEQYVKINIFSQRDKDYSSALAEMNEEKLKRMKEGQILYCTSETEMEDIESFVERAIRNIDDEHVLMGSENLTLEYQAYIIDRILQSKKENNLKMKLRLVGNSAEEKIYRFMKKEFIIDSELQGGKPKNRTYEEFLRQRIQGSPKYGHVKIVTSPMPGLGKTTSILKELGQKNLKPIFFPLSGRVSTKSIFDRLSQAVKQMEDKNFLYGIVIQLYDIEMAKKQIVNAFLTQLCLERIFNYRSEFVCVNESTPIFIELQRRWKEELPFVKLLKTKEIVTELKKCSINSVSFDHKREENGKELAYIVEHLKLYDEKKLDERDVGEMQNFEEKEEPRRKELIEKYFFEKVSKVVEPTFYLYQYWISLLFSSCLNFSSQVLISVKDIKKYYDKATFQKYEMGKLRSQFFENLLENAIDFITFTVDDLQHNNEVEKREKLRNLPFLIIPNENKEWFSFVYKNSSQIPPAIKKFLLATYPKKLKDEDLEKVAFTELEDLEKRNIQQFYKEAQTILCNISGNNSYKIGEDPSYVINSDNLKKMCIICYRMKVNIPLIIQGEAGIGKTALLRHLVRDVFKYEFFARTIDAGFSEESIVDLIEKTEEKLEVSEKKKTCLFLDEFNTFSEMGYIKELIMENKFLGQEFKFMRNKKLIVFAACNPYRKMQSRNEQEQNRLAFQVKKIPLALGQILWNFGSLGDEEMRNYIFKMLHEIEENLPDFNLTELVCKIQIKLKEREESIVSLRDVERLRQLYVWLKQNLPNKPKIGMRKQIVAQYTNRRLRSIVVAISLVYIVRFNSQTKRKEVLGIIDENLTFRSNFLAFKEFEEDDFCSRLIIDYAGIALNSSLKENLFTCFVSLIKCIPLLIIGSPGCSKSLATRIIRDNFRENSRNKDEEIKKYLNYSFIQFQGSQNCESKSLQSIFRKAENMVSLNEREKGQKKTPVIIFDEMGLAESSPDNPLKVIHEPLELVSNDSEIKQRKIGFIGISNTDLDKSKMSRFLILQRPEPNEEDLYNTSKSICQGMLENSAELGIVEEYLKVLSKGYVQFMKILSTGAEIGSIQRSFFGLRDFYSAVKAFAQEFNKINKYDFSQQKFDLAFVKSIFRNFNGISDSFREFKKVCENILNRKLPNYTVNGVDEVIDSLNTTGRRYPLIILSNMIHQTWLNHQIGRKFAEKFELITGSPFKSDERKSQYIVRCLSKVVKNTEKEKVLVANSLNRAVETALFDLFNKFFIKREKNQFYRIAMESGLVFTEIVHPKFNFCITIQQSELSKVTPAFLNRFEKYLFDFGGQENDNLKKINQKKEQLLNHIHQACKTENLGHFRQEFLFANSSKEALSTLMAKINDENPAWDDKELEVRLIKALTAVSTKDFEYILEYVFKEKESLNEKTSLFLQIMKQKEERLNETSKAIILTSDIDFWRSKQAESNLISLELCVNKDEEQIQAEIKNFFKKQQKSKTLLVDFTMSGGGNLNEPLSPLGIEVEYFIGIYENILKNSLLENPKLHPGNVRIILSYNRKTFQKFVPISYLNSFEIFFFDDSTINSSSQDKEKIFQNVKMNKIISEALKCINFELDEDMPQCDSIQTIFQTSFESSISQAEGLFSEDLKDVLLILEGKNITISDEEILEAIKDPENIQKYENTQIVLAEKYFSTKIKGAIVYFITELYESNVFLSYGGAAHLEMMQQLVGVERRRMAQNIEDQRFRTFMKEMAKRKANQIKIKYINLKRQRKAMVSGEARQKKPLQVRRPDYASYSELELSISFSQKLRTEFRNISNADFEDVEEKWNKFLPAYKKEVSKKFGEEIYHNIYCKLNEQWKRRFELDMMIRFLEEKQIPLKNAADFLRHLNKVCPAKDLTFKMMVLLGNEDIWEGIFKIEYLCQFNIQTKGVQIERKSAREMCLIYLKKFMEQLNEQFGLRQSSIKGFKGQNYSERVAFFSKTYPSIVFHVQNFINLNLVSEKESSIANIIANGQFIDFWNETLSQEGSHSLDRLLKDLDQFKDNELFKKLERIYEFLSKILKENPAVSSATYKYLANNLFPRWFKKTPEESQHTITSHFLRLCEESISFCQNSTKSIHIILSPLRRLEMRKGSRLEEIAESLNEAEKFKNLKAISQDCIRSKMSSNLSVLLCNIFYTKMELNNWIISESKERVVRVEDLEDHYSEFQRAFTELNTNLSRRNGLMQILYFSYIKLYLYYFVQIMKPEHEICVSIGRSLNQEGELAKNLRLFCMKILRTKMKIKDIHSQYMKNRIFAWCNRFQEENKIIEEPSRSISVPKALFHTRDCQKLETEFKDSQGKDLHLLHQLIQVASLKPEGRYQILNLFLKFIYSKACMEDHRPALMDFMKAKEEEYSKLLGKVEYGLMSRYAQSKIDPELVVEQHESFNEDHLLILNNLNWILAYKKFQSPVHSLFFTQEGEFSQDKAANFQTCFFPCGTENPYIVYANIAYNDTTSQKVGTYICSQNCDYIYSLGDCGFPRDESTCPKCGKVVGGRGHKLSRKDQGARRLISDKFVNNSHFYVNYRHIKEISEEFWDIQRCYITSEINRMRKKTEVTSKVITNERVQDEVERVSMVGYRYSSQHSRISSITYDVIVFCLESIIYFMISLDGFNEEERQRLFPGVSKEELCREKMREIQKNLEQIRNKVGLDFDFYPWVFGIQSEIFSLLNNFKEEYSNYVKKLVKNSSGLVLRLEQKKSKLTKNEYRILFEDFIVALNNGLIFKEFQEVLEANDMTFHNNFTRQFFEEAVEQIISKHISDTKLEFAKQHLESQGKMQFQFDPFLTEATLNQQEFQYCKILKIPPQPLEIESVIQKYEIVIKEKYLVLEFLLKNRDLLRDLNVFYRVISFSNKLTEKANFQITREGAMKKSVKEFVKEHAILESSGNFLESWKKLSKIMPCVQVACKFFGTMNHELNEESEVGSFLVDIMSKRNANGQIIAGILHNYAVSHNDFFNSLRNTQNKLPKYQKLNLFLENYRLSPQKITANRAILLNKENLERILIENSVASIKYGESSFEHNFELCEIEMLVQLKGISELEDDIEKYKSTKYIGESFCRDSQGNSDCLGQLTNEGFTELQNEMSECLKEELKMMSLNSKTKLKGELECIMLHLKKAENINLNQNLNEFCSESDLDLAFSEIKQRNNSFPQIGYIVPLYEMIEMNLIKQLLQEIPDFYRQSMPSDLVEICKSFLTKLPSESTVLPTPKELWTAVVRFMVRNLSGGTFDPQNIYFDFVFFKEDFWPEPDLMWNYSSIEGEEIYSRLLLKYSCSFLDILENFIGMGI